MTYIGIDVGKSSLVIARSIQTQTASQPSFLVEHCQNTMASIEKWAEGIKGQTVHIVFEATGTYSYRLAYCLDLAEIRYSLVNPSQSAGFAQSMKIVSQNDERDAILLCLYGEKFTPEPTAIVDEHLHQLRQKRHHLSTLITQRQTIGNQIHALDFDPRADKMVKESLESMATFVDDQIKTFKNELYHLEDEQYKQMYEKLITITGIGPASASALIIATNGFINFDTVKKVCKFLGTIPKSKDSGTSVRIKGRIIKTGQPYVRAILYNAAKSAKRYNNACKELYNRLRQNGKPHKVAMIAVINKLIKQAFAIIKNDTVFDNNFACAK